MMLFLRNLSATAAYLQGGTEGSFDAQSASATKPSVPTVTQSKSIAEKSVHYMIVI